MKHNLTVVYIITKLELGGAQKVCLQLFKNLGDSSIKTVLISGTTGTLVPTVKDNPHALLLESMTREVSAFGLFSEIKNFFILIQTLKKLKHDNPTIIVHTHSTKAGIIGRWAAFFAGIPQRVHTIHGYAFHAHQNKLIWCILYSIELLTSLITTHFICVSSYDVALGKKLFPRFRKKYSIIRAAIDWQQFSQEKLNQKNITPDNLIYTQKDPFIFGTIACFKPQKNVLDLLKAFNKVYQQCPHARLEIIGDGVQRTPIELYIQENNLTTAVTLHGWQKTVAPLMINWHAFVLSSLWEGLPCAVVEARLLKLPVISYITGGIPDIIQDQTNGLLCDQKDWDHLAENMLKLITNKTLYTQLHDYTDNLAEFNDTYMSQAHAHLYHKLHR